MANLDDHFIFGLVNNITKFIEHILGIKKLPVASALWLLFQWFYRIALIYHNKIK